jgi:hypothetical protein
MFLRLPGLVKRGEVWIYRRAVPPRLRSVVGASEIKRTLGTDDLDVAQERCRAVRAEVERSLTEGVPTSSSLSFAVTHRGLTTATQTTAAAAEDSPSLSVVFSRYYAERKLPAKTRLEWDLVLARIQGVCGGDVAARAVTHAHVRMLKDSLLTTPARRGGGTLSPVTVQKNLAGLRAVLHWAKRNGYRPSNGPLFTRPRRPSPHTALLLALLLVLRGGHLMLDGGS